MAEQKEMNFEQSIARLEEIVHTMEQGEVPLADSLKLFEEGTKLVSSCAAFLDNAEQKVVKLVKSGGKPILTGLCCWIAIALVSLGMQMALGIW